MERDVFIASLWQPAEGVEWLLTLCALKTWLCYCGVAKAILLDVKPNHRQLLRISWMLRVVVYKHNRLRRRET